MLQEEIPALFLEHDLNIRKKCLEEIKQSVLEETKGALQEIKMINLDQNSKIEILNQASKNMLRQRIMEIYNSYREEKRIPLFVRDQLDECYKDYKKEGGNSYIDKYYSRMILWEVYDENEEL